MKLLGQSSLIRKDGHGSASHRDDRQHQGSRELGWRGKVNSGESLINVVNLEQAQDAERLNQKVSGQGQVFDRHLPQMVYHRRTGET